MAKQEHLDILKQGVEVWNKWRREHANIRPDFSEAQLREITLSFADFSYADLRRTDLSGAYLSFAYLRAADLHGADLSSAYLLHRTYAQVLQRTPLILPDSSPDASERT